MSLDHVFNIIQMIFDSLHRVSLIEQQIEVTGQTVLLGAGSPLDSIGFVTFITELEDRVAQENGANSSDFALVLNDIHEFNTGEKELTAGTIASYVNSVTSQTEKAQHA